MERIFGSQWNSYFGKLNRSHKAAALDTIDFFMESPYHPALRNHPLSAPLEKYRTISVDEDLRILFRVIDNETVLFLKIGTHEEIYKRI